MSAAKTAIVAGCLTAGLLGWAPRAGAAGRDGSHDFDFEFGTWRTHVDRLEHPLTGSTTWLAYDGTTVVSPVWNGRANLVELDVTGPDGRLEGLNLRLYNPDTQQWSLNFANARAGVLTTPTVGGFRGGRGAFYDREPVGGRTVLVRFVITPAGRDTCRFEQAFSADGGHTWEVNWRATDVRVSR